jgi:CheY-like chemotaxis protein
MAEILFVDDDTVTLQLMEQATSLLGHKALLCDSPEDAMNVAIEKQPGLILVDMMMSEMDGLTFIQKIRQNPSTAKIPVVVLSAGQSSIDYNRAIKAGANSYLNKPISLNGLLKTIEEYAICPA